MENFLIDKKPFLPSPQKNAKKQSEAITKRFFVYMATGMMLGAIVLGVFAILGKHYISGYIVVTFVFSTVANFFLLAKGKTLAWSYRIQIFLSILFPFVFQYYCEGIVHSGAAMVWCVVALLGSMTFQKGGQAFGWLLFAILLTCWSAYVELDKFELNVLDPLTAVFFAMNLIMVTVLGFILAEFFMRTQRKLQVRLRERRKSAEKVSLELHRRNRDIEQSLAYAKHIQDNILPAHEKLGAAFYNHFVMYKPKEVVSGDFYWFGRLENKIIYANADCTGHGVPGAFMSMMGFNLLNRIIFFQRLWDPSEILNELDKQVSQSMKSNSRSTDGMDISIVTYDESSKELLFAGAKSNMFVCDGQSKIEEIKGARRSIGTLAQAHAVQFVTHSRTIMDTTSIYLTTDGITDQFGGERCKKFTTKRFADWIASNMHLPLKEQSEELNTTLASWIGENEQTDDILVTGIQFE